MGLLGLPQALKRRAAGVSIDANGSKAPIAPPAKAGPASPRRRRARLLLLLHAAWVAALLLLVAGSLTGRRRRHLDLARQLLTAHEAASGAVPASGGAALAQCGDALQLPQVSCELT